VGTRKEPLPRLLRWTRAPALALAALGMAALPAALPGARPVEAAVTAAQLQSKIDSLVAELRRVQHEDGVFKLQMGRWPVGETSLAVLALRAAGVPPDDPAISRAARFLTRDPENAAAGVYQTALMAMALQATDWQRHREQIAACAAYLVSAQGTTGGWGYDKSTRPDNSNTQFALLGLHAAALSDVPIPPGVWARARWYTVARQASDGGWGYTSARNPYGSMTVAGITSLHLCDLWTHVNRGRCDERLAGRGVDVGLAWLAKHFSVTRNPGHDEWKFYYLYGLERAGVILARRYLGDRDWYRIGVQHLVGDKDEVVLAGSPNESSMLKKCFMLLFLAKGNAPIVLHKAAWRGTWDRHQYDAAFLVQFLGREFGRPFDWQVVPVVSPLDELMAAPLLYISGHGPAGWTFEVEDRICQYVQAGGTLLVEAADGDDEFDADFRAFAARAFPDEPLTTLQLDHPVYSCYFDIPQGDRPRVDAVVGACWVSVLYAPDGLSCPWDIAQFDHSSFKMGVNIITFVTGLQPLQGKLVKRAYYVPPRDTVEARGGAFVVGQIVHGGQWRPHKRAWRKSLARINAEAGISVFSEAVPLDLNTQSPFDAHMLYLTGVDELPLSESACRKLRLYLERGGLLFAEAACGSPAFDDSFRQLVSSLFPDRELSRLPVGHPLLESGEPLGAVRYTRAALEAGADPGAPRFEYVEYGGRAVIIYTPDDLSSAVDGHACLHCPSVLEPSAGALIAKVIMYALSS
jgi:hypothetical protein